MKAFLKSKPGMISVLVFTLMMALAFHRVASKRRARGPELKRPSATATTTAPAPSVAPKADPAPAPAPARPAIPSVDRRQLAEDAAYLDRYYDLDARVRTDHDRQGNQVTRRETASRRSEASGTSEPEEAPAPVALSRGSLRLAGRTPPAARATVPDTTPKIPTAATVETAPSPPAKPSASELRGSDPTSKSARPQRFNPYGRLIKCELVFTIDSTNEQTPLVALVMEPVYNNGALVIPAGAELHGSTRPDRLRNRIFSETDWVLVFPREPNRINGRQLNVRGVALDRVEPDTNGMTWGITDGSYGLEGVVIRTLQQEEIKRFVATFFASGSLALQDRQTDRAGQQAARNNPQNAVLQGLAANFQRIVDDITKEIEAHGVFIRVPAGHQFYFYPTQIIDPDIADVSADIATVK